MDNEIKIYVSNQIDVETYQDILQKLETSMHKPSKSNVVININSNGGSYRVAKVINQKITRVSRHTKTTGIANMKCSSSALLILIPCRRRIGIKGTIFHVHPITAARVIDKSKTEEYYEIISKTLGHNRWKEYINQDFGVNIAKDLGLIHEITEQVP